MLTLQYNEPVFILMLRGRVGCLRQPYDFIIVCICWNNKSVLLTLLMQGTNMKTLPVIWAFIAQTSQFVTYEEIKHRYILWISDWDITKCV